MIRTKTNSVLDHDVLLIRSIEHDVFLKSIKHEASLWVYRHELRRIVLHELVRQTHVFSKPSMRRQLMKEIRNAAQDRIDSKIEKRGMQFVDTDRNQVLLMKEIRACGIRRASVKANHQCVMRELLQNFHRTKLMAVLQELTSSKTLLQIKKRRLLYELHQQHSFPSVFMRQKLMQQIRMAGMIRMQVRENHDRVLEELLFRYWAKQVHVLTATRKKHGSSMPKQVLVELLAYTSSRNLAKEQKQHMLLEMKRQPAFRHPSMRKKLMLETHQQKSSRDIVSKPTRQWIGI